MTTTPPKDKPVLKDKEESAEQDDLQTDEAVAAQDSEINTNQKQVKDEDSRHKNDADDLNVDDNDVGLNKDQGEEFL